MNPDLLSQLRDIHAAPGVPWWPPAPGWWVLALLLLMALAWLARHALRRYRDHQRRSLMLAWVDRLQASVSAEHEPLVFLSTLNQIFKLIALQAFPEHKCAVLAGPEWVDFLTIEIGDVQNAEALRALASGPYEPAPDFDADAICDLTRTWIRRHG